MTSLALDGSGRAAPAGPAGAAAGDPAAAGPAAGLVEIALADPLRPARRPVPKSLRRLLGPVLLVAFWQLGSSTGLIQPDILAGPWTVLHTGYSLAADGTLGHNLAISLRRVALGLLFGVAAAVVLAVVAGLFQLGEDLVDAPVQILRAVPILGLVPLAILWFGIGEHVKVFLVALGTAFPVYINTFAAIRGVDGRFVELARTVRLGRLALIRRVVLPGALPGFLVGLRFALTISWLILVVSEQINASSGIGYLMDQARTFGQTDVIVVGLAVYGVLGLLSDALVRLLERRALAWRRGLEAT
ncbi:ABC transporter permease [Pseudofrankia inefficax]|uniref:Binding-protein-dependent transport systems inner membrane component n=1 Tax=Pseudofrankia inefficax (strain DSM 45817 / CECT 9037 / DDB 130130 / EuI1c) TaxID=298654 RepID=E3J419_PSEI1|nr:ABC transporter permease [Pseudofrankia inefficax]ADP81798.1 binding-protein-dependent transport systems inner membrane component [Pseudofrankia inefficax]